MRGEIVWIDEETLTKEELEKTDDETEGQG